MQFKKDADVMASDGSKVATVDRVVIDPASKQVTHLVIKKGTIFKKHKVLPVGRVSSTSEDEVILTPEAENPEDLPDFEEEYHIPVDHPTIHEKTRTRYATPYAWYHRYPGTVWWTGLGAYPGYDNKLPYMHATRRNIPSDVTPLQEGAKVMDRDGEVLGRVENIYVEPDEHFATHLLVESGILSKSRKIIPTRWIKSVAEDIVRMTVEKEFFEGLPEYEGTE